MKKIISLFSAIGIILLSLSSCIFGGKIMSRYYDKSENYQAGCFELSAENVRTLSINWYSGSIILKKSAGDTLTAKESKTDLPIEKSMHWYLDENILRIEFCASGYNGNFNKADKQLTVSVPENITVLVNTTNAGISADLGRQTAIECKTTSGAIDITTATADDRIILSSTSGSIRAEQLESRQISVDTTSGTVTLNEIKATEKVYLGTTSGSIKVGNLNASGANTSVTSSSGSVKIETLQTSAFDAGTTSGSLTVGMKECKAASIRATSGSIKLNLAQSFGMIVTVTTSSGSFNASGYRTEGKGYVWGDGSCTISIETTSGSITIR